MKEVRLIVVGFGTVGRGVLEVLRLKHGMFLKRFGFDVKVSAVCEVDGCLVNEGGVDVDSALEAVYRGRLKQHPDWVLRKSLEVIKEVEGDIVLELTPGNIKTGEPGVSHIRKALESGKHVVTSNKAPIALRYKELTGLAEKRGLKLCFEACVGGAIPIINLYRDTLEVNEVKSIYGILNGTSNFVLTKMFEEGVSLETALKEAQELGIAEKDPSYDIDGIDSAVKLVILANSLMGLSLSYDDVKVVGVRDISSEAVELARKHGYSIKLVGDVNAKEVSPRLVPLNHPLNVSGVLNAVMFETDVAGPLTLIGRGAGKIETASSVFSDILYILRDLKSSL